MDQVIVHPLENLGRNFIPQKYLPKGKDEYYIRNRQIPWPIENWRKLKADEIDRLVKNGNTSDKWDDILVSEEFNPALVKNNEFYGLIRIGRMNNVILEHHDLQVSVGISNSTIVSCDIGDDVAIHHVRYLAHYIIGNKCILINIDEMHTTNHAKFGNGILKEDESEDVRISLNVINETGSRCIHPFD